MGDSFVPPDFEVPVRYERDGFVIRCLTVHDLVKDYDAVMTSAAHLQTLWPGDGWPEGLTLEQDLIDLGWHQKEFQSRRSFAYTVTTMDDTEIVGCVYIYPTRKVGYDAEVHLWARASRLDDGLEGWLYEVVRHWLAWAWPFHCVGFPGRDPDWPDWWALPEA